MTEWYDDTDPPQGLKLDDEDLCMAWSYLSTGIRVRWVTPLFVRRGTITKINGRSMRVHFDGFVEDTAIPDAKWYWVQAKMGNRQEHMVAIDDSLTGVQAALLENVIADATDQISPAQAANIIGCDQKIVRRMIRSGKLPASRKGGRWVILRSDALAHRR